MENQENLSMGNLVMNTLSEIPDPKPDAQQIVGLVKEHGRVAGYQLSDGRRLSKEQGVALAKQGGIRGVGISERKGNEYLKSLPDGSEANNLGNLPAVPK